MCGRLNIMDMPGIELFLQDLGISSLDLAHELPRYNVAPGAYIPTIGITPQRAQIASWGHEMTIQGSKRLVINTRCEKAATAWGWREAFNTRPAVIFCNGFYEWQRTKAGKQAYFIHDDKPMALAALWFDDEEPNTSIMTEAAGASFAHIHHRQPIALKMPEITQWLSDKESRLSILANKDRPNWQQVAVSPYVNNARNDGAHCIRPIDSDTSIDDEQDDGQLKLPDL